MFLYLLWIGWMLLVLYQTLPIHKMYSWWHLLHDHQMGNQPEHTHMAAELAVLAQIKERLRSPQRIYKPDNVGRTT